MSRRYLDVNFPEIIRADNDRGFNVRDDLKHLSVPELQAKAAADRLPFDICLLNVTGDLNGGNIIRTAHLMGAGNVWVLGRNKLDYRSMVGAENYIPIHKLGGLRDDLSIDEEIFTTAMREHEYTVVLVEQGGHAIGSFDWLDMASERRFCLVFGNEGRGIGDNILAAARKLPGFVVSVPQRGVMRSHNVATTAGVVMWDMISGMAWS